MPAKVKPLRKRTMTLDALQVRTLDVLKKVRKQFNRAGWEPSGMSDKEFIDKVVEPLQIDIQQDREMLAMLAKRKSR